MNIYELIAPLRKAAEENPTVDFSAGRLCILDNIETGLNLGDPETKLWYTVLPEMQPFAERVKELYGDDATVAFSLVRTTFDIHIHGRIFTNLPFEEAWSLYEELEQEYDGKIIPVLGW